MSEPKFIPKPGQVDYTNIRYCPTINCIIKCNDEFLLLKRSPDLNLYPGLWNGVSGFLDDHQDIQDKVREELKEELNILEDKISSIKVFNPFYREEKEYDKT
ncbi:MAG: NUDIX domain-containing protein [Candidatus Pacebacteria bacterium]|jgi:isopentenyldiphosphate isomerase|nr:NUDIX domain-containing protein [Candidatus Paceibacterota bacterium]MDD3808045.1 NUDIX domain-containing protein [Candidatus Paceibacterota bacterium]